VPALLGAERGPGGAVVSHPFGQLQRSVELLVDAAHDSATALGVTGRAKVGLATSIAT